MRQSRYWRHKRKKLIGRYKSVLEAKFAEDLEAKGIGFEYEPETLEYRTRVVRGVCDKCSYGKVSQRRTYLPDFVIRMPEDSIASGGQRVVYVETKGRLTSADRTKMVAVKAAHPELDIRLVFGSDNKLSKNNVKRYSDWATERGFPFGFRTIPDEWAVEFGAVPVVRSASADAGRGRKARHRKGRSTPTTPGPTDPDSEGT